MVYDADYQKNFMRSVVEKWQHESSNGMLTSQYLEYLKGTHLVYVGLQVCLISFISFALRPHE